MSVLQSILASKRAEVAAMIAGPSDDRRLALREPLDVPGALRRFPSRIGAEPSKGQSAGSALRLIAEVKLRSPSAGALSSALAPADRALAYAESGAAMVSVLCDGPFFDGSWLHLASARKRLDSESYAIPLLAKEFVIDPVQVREARVRGADAVLLIARIVDRQALIALAAASRAEGLEPLVEVVDERELDAALAAQAQVIGVNARDLDTLTLDPGRAARILDAIPRHCVAVHLSGLGDPLAVRRVASGRADAALVGEALMRDADPRLRLRAFVEAAAAP